MANDLAEIYTSALATALAIKSGNNKIIYQDILTALAGATNDLSMPCHEQRTGDASEEKPQYRLCFAGLERKEITRRLRA